MFTTAVATADVVAREFDRYGPGPGFGWVAAILIPLFWLGVIALVAWLVARNRRRMWSEWREQGGPPWSRGTSAESTLAQRFANGDIDEVEYRARLEVLRANRPNGG